jgi:hypothetical protein
MITREYIKNQIDELNDNAVERVGEFIMFQRYLVAFNNDENDTDYLTSIPGMTEKIIEGMNTPLSECVSLAEVLADV